MNSFIVMQGETYQAERNAGVLWTPQIDKSGMVPHSWNRMQELKKGDIVFHYVKGSFVAISRVREDCHKARSRKIRMSSRVEMKPHSSLTASIANWRSPCQ